MVIKAGKAEYFVEVFKGYRVGFILPMSLQSQQVSVLINGA